MKLRIVLIVSACICLVNSECVKTTIESSEETDAMGEISFVCEIDDTSPSGSGGIHKYVAGSPQRFGFQDYQGNVMFCCSCKLPMTWCFKCSAADEEPPASDMDELCGVQAEAQGNPINALN